MRAIHSVCRILRSRKSVPKILYIRQEYIGEQTDRRFVRIDRFRAAHIRDNLSGAMKDLPEARPGRIGVFVGPE
jgi:hypothetical protein